MSLKVLARQLEISPPAVGFPVERGEAIAREERNWKKLGDSLVSPSTTL